MEHVWRLDPDAAPEAATRLLEARKALAQRLVEDGITSLVEVYDADRFNSNASVAENLLFGTPIGPVFDFDALADNTYVILVLEKVGLIEDLLAAGKQVAETMIEMFADLPPDHEFFEQFSFINASDLAEFSAILGRIGAGGPAALAKADRAKLLSLPFKLIPARHRLDVLDEAMQSRLLEARRVFRADLPAEARREIEFFDAERYNAVMLESAAALIGTTLVLNMGRADVARESLDKMRRQLSELRRQSGVPVLADLGRVDVGVHHAGPRREVGQPPRDPVVEARPEGDQRSASCSAATAV